MREEVGMDNSSGSVRETLSRSRGTYRVEVPIQKDLLKARLRLSSRCESERKEPVGGFFGWKL